MSTEVRSACGVAARQYKALVRKNYLLARRHKRATSLQLSASVVFVWVIFCAQKAMDARFASAESHKTVHDPRPLVAPPIPPCEEKLYVKQPCFDFVWSGNGSDRIRRIIEAIMANNPGRAISPDKVKSFGRGSEVDEWLSANPMSTPGALHFAVINSTVISYGLQTNSTPLARRGIYEDPTVKFHLPLQIAAEREIARSLIGVPKFSWVVALKEFAHPKIDTFSAITILGPPIFLAAAIFGFVFQISSLVAEKELKLRQAMKLMGLYDSAYWLSWLTWEGLLSFISSLLIVASGTFFRFDFFLNNSFAVVFLVFFFFQLNMLAFAFMLSTFVTKSSSSSTVGFSVFIVGSMTSIAATLNFPYSHRFSRKFRASWSLFPPNLLTKAIWLLSDATATPQDPGIHWSGIAHCSPNDVECVITIHDILTWLAATFFLWLASAIYLDNVLPNEHGSSKSLFYFLTPRYWTRRSINKTEEGKICSYLDSPASEDDMRVPYDEDIVEEENVVKQQMKEGVYDEKIAVQIRGLVKTFPASTKIGCFKYKKIPPYHAIKGLWMNIARDQLFCLLGTSGAGKTSLINCLTGITPVTSGDALVYQNSVQNSVDISRIQKIIGVCPQFDTLWGALTGEEHLHLFARIKGLPEDSIQSLVQHSLEEVRLTEAAKRVVGNYSGGMRRRLSLAIALLGYPKLIILDEPTTGMDPITRRHVWDIILKAKKGRAIILTTHSMEEADTLSDRIGIMANGRLQCIGTSNKLKSRFGPGFFVHVSFIGSSTGRNSLERDTDDKTNREAVKRFFRVHLDVKPKEESRLSLTYAIPRNREMLFPDCFSELQAREMEFGISDVQIGFTSLQEVFLSIAKRAELESATAEGRTVPLNLAVGNPVEIPLGATVVKLRGTESEDNGRGKMVRVHWKQDDFGALCIAGHSVYLPTSPCAEPVIEIIR